MQDQKWVVEGQEFDIGDKVRVMKFVEGFDPDGMGDGVQWGNVWSGAVDDKYLGMDAYMGKEFTILDITPEGVLFDLPEDMEGEFSGGGFMFPLKSLELIAKAGSHEPVKEALEPNEELPFAARLAYYETHIQAVEERLNEAMARAVEDIKSVRDKLEELKKAA